ncbi:CISD3 protein, partial [Leiothrix lutea]|nr:CISD3 protein [Leiothrix lutea]
MLRPTSVPAVLTALMRAARGGRRYRDPSWGERVPSFCSAPPPEPVIAAKEPFPVELKAGKTYSWCSCGHSKRQ